MMRLRTICLLLGLFLLIGCSNKKAQQQTFDPILPVEISVISQTNDNNLRNFAELNYRAGMNTITDVLEAHALLLQAKNAITDRQITYQTASRRYHDLSGQ